MADERLDQRTLPFGEAQGTFDEEKNLLGLALLRVAADLYLAQFMLLLLKLTDAGRRGPLQKTFKQLGATPWALCCSPDKARSVVRRARKLKLCRVIETESADGGQAANLYEYDRELILAILGVAPPVTNGQPPVTNGQPPVTNGQPPGLDDQAHIGTLTPSVFSSSPSASSRTNQGAAGGLVLVRTAKSKLRGSVLAEHVPPDQVLAWQATQQRLEILGVYADLCERLLVQAAGRGATCDDVTALADHFTSRPGAWTPGALTIALKRWSPGQPYDAETLWPPPSDAYRQTANRDADARRRSADEAAESQLRATLEQERLEAQRREAEFGPRLDALSEEQLATLVAATPRAQASVFYEAHKQRPLGGLLRVILIDALAAAARTDT